MFIGLIISNFVKTLNGHEHNSLCYDNLLIKYDILCEIYNIFHMYVYIMYLILNTQLIS